MIKNLSNIKIKHKLIIIIMSTVMFSLLLVGSVLIVSENYNAKQSMVERLMVVSKIIADRSTAALSFDDAQVAEEVLSALEYETSVVLGCMYDINGALFATYNKSQAVICEAKMNLQEGNFNNGKYEIGQNVVLEGEKIGYIYIQSSLEKLNDRLISYVLLVFGMLLMTGILAYLFAKKQQEIISGPILDLAKFAEKISKSNDYSIRMQRGGRDEVGALNRAFNNMLEQIHKRQLARDEAVKALSEREQDLLVTLNSIGDAVVVTDVKGNVTRMNPVAEKLTGWKFSEAEQLPLNTIFPIVDATTRKPIANPVDKVIDTGETIFLSNHTTLISKSGSEIQIADSAAPIKGEDNQVLGMILVFNDVTEQYRLRESAEKNKRDLQAIMDNSPASIYVESIKGEIVFINKQFKILYGLSKQSIIGKKLKEVLPEYISREMEESSLRVLEKKCVIEVEGVIQQQDGEHIMSSVKFPLYNKENEIYAICCISTDITDRKTHEDKLRQSQKMDALGKLTGGVAHDYNNILGIILGYAGLLKEKIKDEKLGEYLLDIEHAAERGAKLTNKLLSFTRHKCEDADLLDINQLLQGQQLMLEKTLTVRINVKLNLEENLWWVWLDSGDLEDAIINLSINASHAIQGSGCISFSTSNKTLNAADAQLLHLEPGEYVLLSVSDTGRGMDEKVMGKIFDPFFSTKGDKGTGLGLSQVYGFVKRSGGGIKVNSELEKGTEFLMYFPRSSKGGVGKRYEQNKEKGSLKGNETVLVVDDEPSLASFVKNVLSEQGYNVFTATSGEEALAIIEKEKINVMLSDVIMPDMDGYHLAETVQKKHPKIKIQMVSGFSDDREEYMQDSQLHENMLYKPYSVLSLLSKVRDLLDSENSVNQERVEKSSKQNIEEESKKSRVLILDDEIDVCDLFELNLEMLGYNTLTANDSDTAIDLYKKHMENGEPIDVMIVDLNIPGSLGGVEFAKEIKKINGEAKVIVCSGDNACDEMINYEQYGFIRSLEKNFDRKKIKLLLEEILM